MGIITIIQIIFMVIQFLPEALTAVKAIIEFIRELRKKDPEAAAHALANLKAAVQAAKNGDTSQLTQLVNHVKSVDDLVSDMKRCAGKICSPDLVGR